MLQLKNIKKVYGNDEENKVHALKGINISFRECEFVSILGPSGCGKTTLLNIIGGLDVATEGDLIFDGVSTKGFNEADWDDYRNSKIGFVFQSYNLIPHLTVLDNVALALTISGVTGEERIKRATEAIEMVGLKEQIHKLPNQMSGGQVQRVAIARAMVMQTPLLLADEPTGAIDSETSEQVMELLKNVSKTRLVIMVTHNAELAEKYSTRIVRVLDGEIISDTDPYYPDEEGDKNTLRASKPEIEPKNGNLNNEENTESVSNPEHGSKIEQDTKRVLGKNRPTQDKTLAAKRKKRAGKRTTMSFGAAVKLSWRNLISKRGRSILTAIAGSIGIICIAIILAVNNGFSLYITKFEKQSLSKYPITVTTGEESVTNMLERLQEQLMGSTDGMNVFEMLGSVDENKDMTDIFPTDKIVKTYEMFVNMMKSFSERKTNDITPFKKYVETMDPTWGDIKYDYSLNFDVYRRDSRIKEDGKENVQYTKINPLSENGILIPVIEEVLDRTGDYKEQLRQILPMLDTFPFWDELVGEDATILAQYDLIEGSMPTSANEIVLVVNEYNRISDFDAVSLKELGLSALINTSEVTNYKKAFEEIMKLDFRVLPPSSAVHLDEETGRYTNLVEKDASDAALIEMLESDGSIPLKISGILRPKPDLKDGCIKGVIGYTSELGRMIIDDANNSPYVNEMKQREETYLKDTEIHAGIMEKLYTYLEEEKGITQSKLESMIKGELDANEQMQLMMTAMAAANELIPTLSQEEQDTWGRCQNNMLGFGGPTLVDAATNKTTSLDDNNTFLRRLNARDLDKPSFIYIYANSIENKDRISQFINDFNAKTTAEEKELESKVDPNTHDYVRLDYTHVVKCTDELDSIVHDMDSMVNTITYILIAVALVSVIVTMFLIAIIMYISVQDRTREIGILRALGSRKLDISNIFNVETLILGLISGVIGVIIAAILQFPGNAITAATLNLEIVVMAWWHPFVLIIGSMLLTLLAGLIPAMIAAKKQPVIALRTDG